MASIARFNRVSSLTGPLLRDTCRIAVPQNHRLWHQVRWSSHAPSSPAMLARGQKPVTIQSLQKMYAEDQPITMLTAHNFPSALMAQEAGMDMILVGDSLAMVSLGMQDTSEVTLDEMIVSARAVSRAVTRSFTVGDLPMGSYELSPEQALASAIRMVKEGRMQSVKLEGGAEMAPAIKKITTAGIPLCAHIGLTPQRQHALGGFRVQGNTLDKAMSLLKDAKAVEEAGAFMVVLECVPPDIAEEVTKVLRIPTIGIGAGNKTSGQVLVQIDMLGVRPPDSFMPKFVKKYGSIWEAGLAAIKQYKDEVSDRSYPGPSHVYKGDAKVTAAFKAAIQSDEAQKA
ncbi:3-methyl-2-oxobutanoate hydroxymethyltransferase [Cladophialophora bantiana CBS 173.52]|uniref:3-methyl-2-oxobutanoate hydroxymethyltransferase n=1 Tax=Cladophialophora bantiana (strain ATCC 10958 / CBS 173.52 / CDC B-1940 / NIH 8579) TaxID=1442370 RepID=A0A0D2IHK2_CLAB1|nr:3-methyl-2-oxobutanoate hydroxymethyltransferase [Cladophialophora bantiana CBS 173.52]KIW96199.1 3-methyl-2-oxobutanoate hydroxymethyltransferase [Cladophialophora bantiana CBS 173.52]